jgi:hypothetical protein
MATPNKLKKGDTVTAAKNNDYAGLKGVITAIELAGTPEHDCTDNDTDDIHVDFRHPDNTLNVIADVARRLDSSIGDLALDDVIMSPAMLLPENEINFGGITVKNNGQVNNQSFKNYGTINGDLHI